MTDLDLPLSEEGIAAAQQKAREQLEEIGPLQIMISSKFTRSRLTRDIYAQAQIKRFDVHPILIDTHLLNERDHGATFGLTDEEIRNKFPRFTAAKQIDGEFRVRFPEGETLLDVDRRIDTLLNDHLATLTDHGIGLFGHWGTHFCLIHRIKNLSQEEIVQLMRSQSPNYCDMFVLNHEHREKITPIAEIRAHI